jgi:hypothetical protein
MKNSRSSRRPLPWPSPVVGLLIATTPTLASFGVWYLVEPMGRFELAASIAIGVFVSLLIWGLFQIEKDKRRHMQEDV